MLTPFEDLGLEAKLGAKKKPDNFDDVRHGLEIALPVEAAGKTVLQEALRKAEKAVLGDLVLVMARADDPFKEAVSELVDDQLRALYPGAGKRKLRKACMDAFEKKCKNEDFVGALKKGFAAIEKDHKGQPKLQELKKLNLVMGLLHDLVKNDPPKGFTRDYLRNTLISNLTPAQRKQLEKLSKEKPAEKEKPAKDERHVPGKEDNSAVARLLVLHKITTDAKFVKRYKELEDKLEDKGKLPPKEMKELEHKRDLKIEYDACDRFRQNKDWDQIARGKYIKARKEGVKGEALEKLEKELQKYVADRLKKSME